jgi:hypothetical protein
MQAPHQRYLGTNMPLCDSKQDGAGQEYRLDLGRMDEEMCKLGYDVQISMLGPAILTIPPFCKRALLCVMCTGRACALRCMLLGAAIPP